MKILKRHYAGSRKCARKLALKKNAVHASVSKNRAMCAELISESRSVIGGVLKGKVETKDKVIEKIKKLLILADTNKNSNLEEATAAAEKAQALMEKHRIEQEMLNIHDALGLERLGDEGLPSTWKVFLTYVIAKHNGCYIIKSEDYDKDNKILLVGEGQDIKSVQSVYKYLVFELSRLCFGAILKYQATAKQLPNKNFAESFYTGAIQAIDHRLQEINKTVRNQHIINAGSTQDVAKVCSAIERLDNRIQNAKAWISNQRETSGIKDVRFQSETVAKDNQAGFEAGVRAACDLDLEQTSKKLPENKNKNSPN